MANLILARTRRLVPRRRRLRRQSRQAETSMMSMSHHFPATRVRSRPRGPPRAERRRRCSATGAWTDPSARECELLRRADLGGVEGFVEAFESGNDALARSEDGRLWIAGVRARDRGEQGRTVGTRLEDRLSRRRPCSFPRDACVQRATPTICFSMDDDQLIPLATNCLEPHAYALSGRAAATRVLGARRASRCSAAGLAGTPRRISTSRLLVLPAVGNSTRRRFESCRRER